MTGSDRDLVSSLRAELAAIDPPRTCDREAESLGLGSGLATREASVARLAVRLGRGTDARKLLQARRRPKRVHAGDEPASTFDWAAVAEHCRLAYLRGVFLADGSLSLAAGRTHLEFVLGVSDAPVLAERLGEIGLPASWRVRRRRGVVTWKSAETVVTFLRRIGAGSSLLELEARQVSRAMRGDLNRVINAESANLQRVVAAAGRQLEAISTLERDGRLADQPLVVRAVAAARRETPEATLAELAERLDLHRSAVQRALDRIERLALHPEDDPGDRRPNGRASGDRRRPRRVRSASPSLA